MYDFTTYFSHGLLSMMKRKSIDTVLLSVDTDKLTQREWDWIKVMKPMDSPPAMVASAILEHRGDIAALSHLPQIKD